MRAVERIALIVFSHGVTVCLISFNLMLCIILEQQRTLDKLCTAKRT